MGWKLFKNPEFFAQIGRMGTARLLEKFAPEFKTQGVKIPDGELPEKEYFKAVASLGASKSGFPDKLHDVLYGVHELGCETGKDRLIYAASANPELRGKFNQTTTCEEFAVLFYLSESELFEKTVREMQILARSSFQVFGSSDPEPSGKPFSKPTKEELRLFKGDVDEWVAREYRGDERATEIEHYETEDQHLFLIRMGDSSIRQAIVEDGSFTYQHFRPARDLVVTYAPARDEVRVNGKGAKKIRMLRETFGRRFFGKPDKFSVKDPFTLAPLVLLKEAALKVGSGHGIDKIVLTELVQETDSVPPVKVHLRGPDLFEFSEREQIRIFWPKSFVIGAGFDVHFTGQTEPRQFFLREGNGLRQVRDSDVAALYHWMTEIGFRKTQPTKTQTTGGTSDGTVERD